MVDFTKKEEELKSIVDKFENELREFRTGRAHASIVENAEVEAYGAKNSICHVASISVPDARTIIITPWDKSLLQSIEHAVGKTGTGLKPVVEKDHIRISMQPPTEERRIDLIKILGKKAEETRISVRRTRDEIWKQIQNDANSGSISEDQKYHQKEQMEKLIEKINKRISEVAEKKEAEITF